MGKLGGCFFFQAEDGIRDLVRSRGLGDVYKRQVYSGRELCTQTFWENHNCKMGGWRSIDHFICAHDLSLIHI